MKKLRFPPMSRGRRILKNLLLTALLIVLAWGFADFPINDPYQSFRRAERANWVGPAEIQGIFQAKYNDAWAVGTYQDQILVHRGDDEKLSFWQRRSDGPELLPIPDDRVQSGEVWVVAVDVPEGTATAKLTTNITCYYWYRMNGLSYGALPAGNRPDCFDRTYVAQGEVLEDGAVLFYIVPQAEAVEDEDPEMAFLSMAYEWQIYRQEKDIRGINCTMRAVFYDAAGRELGSAQLSTPE